jgi:hypothetical protein
MTDTPSTVVALNRPAGLMSAKDFAAVVEAESKPPFVSKFGRLKFSELDLPGPEYEYIIDGFLSCDDKSIIGGPSMSGKSFLAIHAAMCIARNKEFFGRSILKPGLVIYQAGEGARGIKKRLRAFRQHFQIPRTEEVPFELLQSKIDVYRPEGDTSPLIEEIKAIASEHKVTLVAVFIDTLATAMGGAEENSGSDMAAVMGNLDRIKNECKCHVSLVHHLNASGTKLRGHTSIFANLDQVIMVNCDQATKVRTAVLGKQKDDVDGVTIKFELMSVKTGRLRKQDGKDETSCVCVEVGEKALARAQAAAKGFALRDKEDDIFRAFWKARKEKPFAATDEMIKEGFPGSHLLVHAKDFRDAYRAGRFVDNAEEITTDAIRKIWDRNSKGLIKFGVLFYKSPYIWWEGKPIKGYPETSGITDDGRTDSGQNADSRNPSDDVYSGEGIPF